MFSLDKFLVVSADGKNIYIRSDDGTRNYTVAVFNIGVVFVTGNLLKIKHVGTDQIITIPFRNVVEANLAVKKLQDQIDVLREKTPFILEKGMQNYVDDKITNVDVDLSGIYATLSVFENNFTDIYATLSVVNDNFTDIYATLSVVDDNFTDIYATLSVVNDNFTDIYATLSNIFDTKVSGLDYTNPILTLSQNDGSTFSVTISTSDIFTTGVTLSNNDLIFNRNDGLTYSVDLSGFSTSDSYVTGLSFSNGVLSLGQTGVGQTFTASIPDTFVTGLTYSGSNLTLEQNDGSTFSVTISTSDIFTTGATLSSSELIFNRNDGLTYSVNLSTLSTTASGTNGLIQYNKNGSFASDPNLYFDEALKFLYLGGIPSSTASLSIIGSSTSSTTFSLQVHNSTLTSNSLIITDEPKIGIGRLPDYTHVVSTITGKTQIDSRINIIDNSVNPINSQLNVINTSNTNSSLAGVDVIVGGTGSTVGMGSTGVVGGFAVFQSSSANPYISNSLLIQHYTLDFNPGNTERKMLFSLPSNNTNSRFEFHSGSNGSVGTGGSRKLAISGNRGNVIIGNLAEAGTSATRTFVIQTGTAPTGNITDAFQLYSADRAAGQAGAVIRSENGTQHIFADRVGVRTITPNAALEVIGLGIDNQSFSLQVHNSTGTNNALVVRDDGFIGIGSASPTARLFINTQGALSTDLAFRIRNSSNNADLFSVQGNAITNFGGGVGGGGSQLQIICGSGWGTNCFLQFAGSRSISNLAGGSVELGFYINHNTNSRNVGVMIGNSSGTQIFIDGGSNIRIGQGFSNMNQPDANATRTLLIANGVAPTTSPADIIQMYSADIVAGNAAPHFRTENGSIIKLYQQPAVTTSQGIADALTNAGLLASGSVVAGVDELQVALTAQVFS